MGPASVTANEMRVQGSAGGDWWVIHADSRSALMVKFKTYPVHNEACYELPSTGTHTHMQLALTESGDGEFFFFFFFFCSSQNM